MPRAGLQNTTKTNKVSDLAIPMSRMRFLGFLCLLLPDPAVVSILNTRSHGRNGYVALIIVLTEVLVGKLLLAGNVDSSSDKLR